MLMKRGIKASASISLAKTKTIAHAEENIPDENQSFLVFTVGFQEICSPLDKLPITRVELLEELLIVIIRQ